MITTDGPHYRLRLIGSDPPLYVAEPGPSSNRNVDLVEREQAGQWCADDVQIAAEFATAFTGGKFIAEQIPT